MLMTNHRNDIDWLQKYGGAIIRRVRHMLMDQSHNDEQSYCIDECLLKMTRGHQTAALAWIWQVTELTWDMTMRWTAEQKRVSQQHAQAYLSHWNLSMMQRPGVMEYLNKHTGSLVHTFVWQLRKSRSRLR